MIRAGVRWVRLGVVFGLLVLAGLLLLVSRSERARAAAACPPATGHRAVFERSNGKPQLFGVPPGVTHLAVDVQGGHGGQKSDTWLGGKGGGVRARIDVARLGTIKCLTIYVGEYGSFAGGYGWAHGGRNGTIRDLSFDCGHSGAGGGGASGIAFGSGGHFPVVVAGGGGGGGGDGCYFQGGAGGAAGKPAFAGADAKRSGSHPGGLGGCGGCAAQQHGNSGQGQHRKCVIPPLPSVCGIKVGAGGGGGGGIKGGDGGKLGDYRTGGGGGGGGTSYARPVTVSKVQYFTSERSCPYKREGADCNGIVIISWQ